MGCDRQSKNGSAITDKKRGAIPATAPKSHANNLIVLLLLLLLRTCNRR